MGAAERFAALCLALVACPILHAPLQAQSPSDPPTAWVRLTASEAGAPYIPAFGSYSSATASAMPPVAPHLVAVYAVPCGADGAQLCLVNPFSRFLDSTAVLPLSPAQKAHLALRDLTDPATLASIGDTAAFTIAANSHTAYGPGWSGFVRESHYSFLQDAAGEFFGTFLIPSLVRQDPHYHRMPDARIPRRLLHALSSTLIAQSDSGAPMPNLATLLTYPIDAEIGNLYLPGVRCNGPSTVTRILTGYATDPVDNLLAEFLPRVAQHVNLRVILAQRLLN